MATLEQLERALVNADRAGDAEDARILAAEIVRMRQSQPVIQAEPMALGSKAGRSDSQRPVRQEVAPDYGPTSGMSGFDGWAAGTGSGFNSLYRGGQQVGAGIVDTIFPREGQSRYDEVTEKVAEARRLDEPLMATDSGKWGNLTANVAAVVGPGALAKAIGAPTAAFMPTTARGALAQGAVLGGMQPALSGEERLGNVALGAGAGYVGGKIADGISSMVRPPAPTIPAQRAAALQAARDAGYVITPGETGARGLTSALEGLSGKAQIGQAAATRNQEVTNRLARKALGVSDDVPLNRDTLNGIRSQAGQVYGLVGKAGEIKPTLSYFRALDALSRDAVKAAKSFPDAPPSPVLGMVQSLKTGSFDAGSAVAQIKLLREQADSAFRNGSTDVGKAARGAARALEDAIEKHLIKQGQPDLLRQFREARQLIARTYTVERGLNDATGDVSAKVLADLLRKGKPLTGDLATIARTGEAFKESTKTLTTPYRPFSPWDLLAGGAGVGSGKEGLIAAVAGRPIARGAMLSGPMQNMLARQATQGYSVIPPLPALVRNSSAARVGNAAQRRALPAGLLGYALTGEEDR